MIRILFNLFLCLWIAAVLSCNKVAATITIPPVTGSLPAEDTGTLYPMIQKVYPGTLQSLDIPLSYPYDISPEFPGITVVFSHLMENDSNEMNTAFDLYDASSGHVPISILPVSPLVKITVTGLTTFTYHNPGADEGPLTDTTGTVTAAISSSSSAVQRTGGIATITTKTNHNFRAGESIIITGLTHNAYNSLTPVLITAITATTLSYSNPGADEGPLTDTTGTVTVTAAISSSSAAVQRTGGIATITTTANHNFLAGDSIIITGLTHNAYNSLAPVLITAITATTISYSNPGADEGSSTDTTGTVTATIFSLSATVQRANGVATLTTAANHRLSSGTYVNIAGLTHTAYNPISSNCFTIRPFSGSLKSNTLYALRIYKYASAKTELDTISVSRSGNVATVFTSLNHGLSNNDLVTISGLTNSGYNTSSAVPVTVTGTSSFTYSNSGTNQGTTSDTTGLVKVYSRTLVFDNLVTPPATTISPADPLYVEYKFRTGDYSSTDITPPIISFTSITNGAENVDPDPVGGDGYIEIIFNDNKIPMIDPSTVNDLSVTLYDVTNGAAVPGDISCYFTDTDFKTFRFYPYPTTYLLPSTEYRLRISAAPYYVTDFAGNEVTPADLYFSTGL